MKTTIEVGDLVKRFPLCGDQTITLVSGITLDGEWVYLVGAGDSLTPARSLMVLSKANDSRDLAD